MRHKPKPYPRHDADKDIDTNENPSHENLPHLREWQEMGGGMEGSTGGTPPAPYRTNVNEGVRHSPPPLPDLIFDPEDNNSNKSLVGSTTSIENDQQFGPASHEVAEDTNQPGLFGYNIEGRPINPEVANGNVNVDAYTPTVRLRTERKAGQERIAQSAVVSSQRNCHTSARLSKSSKAYLRASAPEGRLNSPEEIAKFIGVLRKERSKLLQEIEQEEEIRSIFYSQLEALHHRLRHLPPEYNVGCERWQLEGEMCHVQEALVERLGSPTVILHRRDQRLHNINGIEKTIQRLRQDASTMAGREAEESNHTRESLDFLNANQVEMVYGLLSMFSSGDKDDMSKRLLAMSSSPDSCLAMRQSGCLPLLIQLLHGGDEIPPTRETRIRASQALQNIVHSHLDDKRGRREARVLRLLSQIREYSDYIYEELERTGAGHGPLLDSDMSKHPCATMAAIMKLSFDEDHRHAMCALGGLHAIAEVIRRDHEAHGSATADQFCITLRRYAGMALTNLTFGDGTNKSLLCSFRSFMRALVLQLNSPSEELKQVTASILRNLSWRADSASKISLREVGAVRSLVNAALSAQKESTLKVILSAVWNMSSHCSMNKADICSVDNALAFMCSTLTYKSQAKTLSIVENGGGILRNVSSHIAICDDLRQVLRDHNSLGVLLTHLRSPSLTVVSNACGTLWNLSARCPKDQLSLWELGAVPMLRSLINSKHKMISMGSSAALKNLLQAKPEGMSLLDHRNGGMPSLQARKQKALVQELDPNLSETCDNIETSPRASPTSGFPPTGRPLFHSFGPQTDYMMSDSRETVASTHSDKSHDRLTEALPRRPYAGDSFGGETTSWSSSNRGTPGGGFVGGARPINRGDTLHSKVSFLDNKYCNGGNKLSAESSSRLQSAIDERELESPEEDYTIDYSYKYNEEGGTNPLVSEEDAVQTFCTEGTPYETPFLRSNAGSNSDLSETKHSRKISKSSLPSKEMHDIEIEDLDQSSTPSFAVRPNNRVSGPPKVGDEHPTQYCIEDTPGTLSRYSSVSSISSEEMNQNIDKELLEDEKKTGELIAQQALKVENQLKENDTEGSIDGNGTMCNETPLMFSRTTSVGSLSSMEVQSIHDDRSSVFSDFSRMTSGALSPSDLPDSPSQTMPTTPKQHNKTSYRREIEENPSATGFFRETTTAFMDEGTPAEFSCSTSLSNLTFDGYEIPLRARSRGDGKDSSGTNSVSSAQSLMARDPNQRRSFPQTRASSQHDGRQPGGEISEEVRLAALIQSGMPETRRPLSGTRAMLSSAMHPIPLPPPAPSAVLDAAGQRSSSIPIKTANLTVTVEAINLAPSSDSQATVVPPAGWTNGDTMRNFCTENTPVTTSQSGSTSDLSQISIATDAGSTRSSAKSQTSTPDDQQSDNRKRQGQVLENCIQSGMPKPRPIPRARSSRSKPNPAMPPTAKAGIFHARTSPNQRVVPVAMIKPQAITTNANQLRQPDSTKPQDVDPKQKKIPVFASKPKCRQTSPFKPNKLEEHIFETPKKYVVENTPTNALSRDSSLSSIVEAVGGASPPSELPKPRPRRYEVENTPTCFSRNSSLSSLSVGSSVDDETASREQALLQKCIRDGMPSAERPARQGGAGSRIPSLRSPVGPASHDRSIGSLADSADEGCPPKGSGSGELTSEESRSTVIATAAASAIPRSSSTTSPEDRSKSGEDNSTRSFTTGGENSACDSLALVNEALRVARNISSDDVSQMSYSGVGSVSDAYLDNVQPPSVMENMSLLSIGLANGNEDSSRLTSNVNRRVIECRHTLKLSSDLRRTQLVDPATTDGVSLASSCNSNIDNIPPPSMMMAATEDDMESSMISVDSITSEVIEGTKNSPPSMGVSLNSEMMGEMMGTAHDVARMLLRDSMAQSSATIVAGDDASTYQELTELEKDETIGAHNTELMADELHGIPELPFDSPKKSAGGLTPLFPKAPRASQLLKLKDRYRSDQSTCGSSSSCSSRSSSPKTSSRQRRVDQPERFKTRTISCRGGGAAAPAEVNGNVDAAHQTRRSLRHRRQEDPLRYKTRTIDAPVTDRRDQHEIESASAASRIVNFQDVEEDISSLTSDQIEAFSQDANIVICSLNETREDMMEDARRLLSEECLLDTDSLSLISNDDDDDDDDDEDELIASLTEEAVTQRPKQPRIVKPGDSAPRQDAAEEAEDHAPTGKVVRGGRRGLFSSHAHRHHIQPTAATAAPVNCSRSFVNPLFRAAPSKMPMCAPTAPASGAKLPRATRASTLRHNSHSKEESRNGGTATKSNGTNAKLPKPCSRTRDAPPVALQRQNTFTKEDKDGGSGGGGCSSFEKQHQRRVPVVQQRGACRPKNR